MLIVSHVCAEFTLPDGTPFRIRPQDRRSFLSVPDALSGDLLFQALLEDGSIESAETKQARSRLERDPDANITPSGRKNPAQNTSMPVKFRMNRMVICLIDFISLLS